MLATWPILAAQVADALPSWDSWCPDDGRPAAALAAAWRYVAAPTLAHRAALETALAGAQAAWLNALQTDAATWDAGGPQGGARRRRPSPCSAWDPCCARPARSRRRMGGTRPAMPS